MYVRSLTDYITMWADENDDLTWLARQLKWPVPIETHIVEVQDGGTPFD